MSSDRPSLLPQVTVLMPVYNGEAYIAETIESILNQTHKLIEFIIIDDGSTDGTARIVSDCAARDERIRFMSQENQDQPATLNRGLSLASHAWVAITDHDDISLPERLERQCRFLLDNAEVRVLGTHAFEINAQGQRIGMITWGPTTADEFNSFKERGKPIGLVHPSVIIHRDTAMALGGYDPMFGSAADAELWSRIADQHLVLALPEPLVCYRFHPRSMSSTRFFEQRRALRWVRAREKARRNGKQVPTLAEHLAQESRPFGFGKLRYMRQDWNQYLIRRSRHARNEGRWIVCLIGLAIALPLAPPKSIKMLIDSVSEIRD